MNTKITRTLITALIVLIVSFALFGVMYVFDILTLSELKDYSMKVGVAVLIVAVSALVISFALSLGRTKEQK